MLRDQARERIIDEEVVEGQFAEMAEANFNGKSRKIWS
jgi:hypothetical protein